MVSTGSKIIAHSLQRIAIVFNPYAGGLKGAKRARLDAAVEIFRRAGRDVELMPTTGPNLAGELGGVAIERGFDLLLAAGGDGTINEVLNGIIGSQIVFGALPAGTANVLANEIGLGLRPDHAAAALLEALPTRIAVGAYDHAGEPRRHFLMMAGAGLDARIVHELDLELKRKYGKLSYWHGGFSQLGRDLPKFRVTVNGVDRLAGFALIARVRNYGGDFEIAKDIRLTDNDFEIVIFERNRFWDYLAFLFAVIVKRLDKKDGVTVVRSDRAEFTPISPTSLCMFRPMARLLGWCRPRSRSCRMPLRCCFRSVTLRCRFMRLLAAIFIVVSCAYAQPQCSADGVVVNSVTGAPIVRARVTMNQDAAPVLTDESGRWRFEHLLCGTFTADANRQNFLPAPTPRVVQLNAGTPLHDVTIRLAPQSVITGRVTDDHGDAVQNTLVAVRVSRVSGGVRQVEQANAVRTNDIGEYRIAGLPAGKYIFCAGTALHQDGRTQSYQAYREQCSTLMTIPAGYSGSADFQLAPLLTSHVRGAISGMPEDVSPQLVLACTSGSFSAGTGANGEFDIAGVPPGACTVLVTAFQESDRLVATQPVEVGNSDVEGLRLHMERSFNVSGTVRVVSPTGKEIDPPQFSTSLRSSKMPIDSMPSVWNVDSSTFTVPGVLPGDYRLQLNVPAAVLCEERDYGWPRYRAFRGDDRAWRAGRLRLF